MIGWTQADQAELDVLLHALTVGYDEHRPNCARCAGPLPCQAVQRAISEVLEWREARALLSRAEALRTQQRTNAA